MTSDLALQGRADAAELPPAADDSEVSAG